MVAKKKTKKKKGLLNKIDDIHLDHGIHQKVNESMKKNKKKDVFPNTVIPDDLSQYYLESLHGEARETKECPACGYAKADKGRVNYKTRLVNSMIAGSSILFVTFLWLVATFMVADSAPDRTISLLILVGLCGIILAVILSCLTFGIMVHGFCIRKKWTPRG